MRTYRRHLAVAGLTAIALVSAACGSSGGSGSSETTAGATTSAAAAESSTTAAAAGGSSTTAAAAGSSSSAAPAAGGTQKGAAEAKADEDAGKAKPLKATGDPVVIGFQNPEGDPNGSFPEFSLAAQAAAKYINEELGGIGGDTATGKPGRPIQLEVCKMAIAPAESIRCANELAAKKPFAVVSSINFFGNHFEIYKAANVPVVVATPVTALDFTSPGVYATGGGGGCLGVHTGMVWFMTQELKVTGKVAVPWANTPPGVFCYHDLEKKPLEVLAGKKLAGGEIKAEGNDMKGKIPSLQHMGEPVLPGQPDVTPQATKVLDFKPDGIMFSGQGADCWTVAQSMAKLGWSAEKTPTVFSGACIDIAKMKELGDVAKGVHLIGAASILTPEALDGQLKEEALTYMEKMKKYADADTAGKGFATVGFTTMMQIWEMANQQSGGDPTKLDGAAFSKTLGETKDHHAWGSTGLSCADGAANAPYIAVCNTTVSANRWDGEKFVAEKQNFSGLSLIKGTELDFGK